MLPLAAIEAAHCVRASASRKGRALRRRLARAFRPRKRNRCPEQKAAESHQRCKGALQSGMADRWRAPQLAGRREYKSRREAEPEAPKGPPLARPKARAGCSRGGKPPLYTRCWHCFIAQESRKAKLQAASLTLTGRSRLGAQLTWHAQMGAGSGAQCPSSFRAFARGGGGVVDGLEALAGTRQRASKPQPATPRRLKPATTTQSHGSVNAAQ